VSIFTTLASVIGD